MIGNHAAKILDMMSSEAIHMTMAKLTSWFAAMALKNMTPKLKDVFVTAKLFTLLKYGSSLKSSVKYPKKYAAKKRRRIRRK